MPICRIYFSFNIDHLIMLNIQRLARLYLKTKAKLPSLIREGLGMGFLFRLKQGNVQTELDGAWIGKFKS